MVFGPTQRIRVKDQGHLSVAHDGGPGIDGLALEGLPEGLDYHFLFADQAIDDDPPGLPPRVDDEHDAFTGFLYPIVEAKLAA